MSYSFKQKPVATVKAKVTGTSDIISVAGTNVAETNPENAKAQIDKLLALVGTKKVSVTGMSRVRTEEAIDND